MSKASSFALRVENCFGVASALSEKAKIYHDSLFSTRHLGRVSDLLVARLKEMSVDELRLRAVILFALFEARQNSNTDAAGSFLEPLILECGVDELWVTVGVSFVLAPEVDIAPITTLSERLGSSEAADMPPFERLVRDLKAQCHELVVKVEERSRRVELIAALGKNLGVQDLGRSGIRVINLSGDIVEAPKASEYLDLADLEFTKLLAPDQAGKGAAQPLSGDAVVKAALNALDASKLVKGAGDEAAANTLVKGAAQDLDKSMTVVKGSAPQEDKSFTTIKGVTDRLDGGATTVAGGLSPLVDAGEVAAYQRKIGDLQKRIIELEAKVGEMPELAQNRQPAVTKKSDDGLMDPSEGGESVIANVFKSFFGKAKKTLGIGASAEQVNTPDGEAAEKGTQAAKIGDAPDKEEEALVNEPKVTEVEANNLIAELEEGSLEKTLNKAQREVVEIKKDIPTQAGKQWIEGFMADLIGEKARLQEMAKKVSVAMKQKEHEFKKKENVHSLEMKTRDDDLKQKDLIIRQLKEQAQARAQDAGKSGSKTTQDKIEEGKQKEKVEQVQRELGKAKDENMTLQSRLKDLAKQIADIQAEKKSDEKSAGEMGRMKEKVETLGRQGDELKKLNQNLMDKMAEMKKKAQGTDGSIEEMKQKMENSVRMATAYKKEAEKSKEITDNAKREVTGLKVDLSSTQAELKRMKALMAQKEGKANLVDAKAGIKPPGSSDTSGGSQAA